MPRTLLQTDRHIEAPNWLPDGQGLLVNAEGRLWRVPLDAPALIPVDTGFASRLNNDHGPAPDGGRIAICDKTETGQSRIYTVRAAGGAPTLVTPEGPSWFHGWSPDGARLVYAAVRADRFDIYTIAAGGGPETRVTDGGFVHADGPDFTGDGAWIWFNGERACDDGQGDGAMDLWRVRPDGSGLQRMTSDARVNWFPHPRPGGTEVLYLAYAPGTEGHPAERPVELRMMPAAGGKSRLVRALLGGQGTINTPCWAPDGSRFAYVEMVAV